MNRVKNTQGSANQTKQKNPNSPKKANRGNTSRGNANISNKRIQPLLYKPEYMHYAYLLNNARHFVNHLQDNKRAWIKPMRIKRLKVRRNKEYPMSFNYPSFHRNTQDLPPNASQKDVIGQTIPSSKSINKDPNARWRIIMNPYPNREIQGPDILNTMANTRGYFGLRGPVELTRTTNERTRFIELFHNTDPNVENSTKIIKTKLKPGAGIIFLNTTLHRPPPERSVGEQRFQVIYDTKWTPAIMKLLKRRAQ